MNPGSDMPCGAASSVTLTPFGLGPPPPPASVLNTERRVRSASAANTRSSASSEYLTIGFSICRARQICQASYTFVMDLGLTPAELRVLKGLNTPRKIQTFLHDLKQNFELDGECCRPVREVLRTRSAHCIEGAMLAAAALWLNGERPLLLDLRAERDYDHVVTLYRRHGCWGAFSKTNGIGLRSRDPVYRTLRELAISYFHEYTNRAHHKTLREYSLPYDLRRVDPGIWVTGTKLKSRKKNAWEVAEALDAVRHFPLVGKRQLRVVTRRDPFERTVGESLQYRPPKKKK